MNLEIFIKGNGTPEAKTVRWQYLCERNASQKHIRAQSVESYIKHNVNHL